MILIQIYNICWIFESLLLIYLLTIAFDKLIINLLYLILLIIPYNIPNIAILKIKDIKLKLLKFH